MKAVIIGATGAVGEAIVRELLASTEIDGVTVLVRRPFELKNHPHADKLQQYLVDLFDADSYMKYLPGHVLAYSCLGVSQPSKVTPDVLEQTDYQCVLTFARCCKDAGVQSFHALTAVGSNVNSGVHYLKVKGRLECDLEALGFASLGLFQPSMLMTDTNRYDWKQGLALKVFPLIDHLLIGPLKKYRSVHVVHLGKVMAQYGLHCLTTKKPTPLRRLVWEDFFLDVNNI